MAKKNRDLSYLAPHLSDDDIISLLQINSARKEILKTYLHQEAQFPNDPLEFITTILGYSLWEKQVEITKSLIENRYTVVEAGKGVGKSYLLAALACYWLSTHETGIVVTLAPSHAHIQNVLWRYIRTIGRSKNLPGRILDTPRWEIGPERYGIGLSPRKTSAEDVTALQGYHNPYLLVIIDEGAGIPRVMWDTVDGLTTSEYNRIVVAGNPIGQTGPFWDACINPRWHRINISALENPNVVNKKEIIPGLTSYTWILEKLEDHCRPCNANDPGSFLFEERWYMPDAYFQAQVLGVAPLESEDQLISIGWIKTAQLNSIPGVGEIIIGFDPSRGGDYACMLARQGGKVLWVKRRKPISNDPSGELAGWLKEEMDELGCNKALIDDIGVGAGVLDAARRLGIPVFPATFSRSASQGQRFMNLRAECYWRVRDAFQKGKIEIPDDDLLERDLIAQKYTFDAMGRILMEPKEKIKDALGHSPDSSDALAITFAQGGLFEEIDRSTITRDTYKSLIVPSRWLSNKIQTSKWRRMGP